MTLFWDKTCIQKSNYQTNMKTYFVNSLKNLATDNYKKIGYKFTKVNIYNRQLFANQLIYGRFLCLANFWTKTVQFLQKNPFFGAQKLSHWWLQTSKKVQIIWPKSLALFMSPNLGSKFGEGGSRTLHMGRVKFRITRDGWDIGLFITLVPKVL